MVARHNLQYSDRSALPLCRLANPVAKITKPVRDVELIQTSATDEGDSIGPEDSKFVGAAACTTRLARLKPSKSVVFGVLSMSASHPPHHAHRIQRFAQQR